MRTSHQSLVRAAVRVAAGLAVAATIVTPTAGALASTGAAAPTTTAAAASTVNPNIVTALRGRVTDAATGRPIAGATVSFWFGYRTATTDARGRYFLDLRVSLGQGLYRGVQVSAPGYVTQDVPLRIRGPVGPTMTVDAVLQRG